MSGARLSPEVRAGRLRQQEEEEEEEQQQQQQVASALGYLGPGALAAAGQPRLPQSRGRRKRSPATNPLQLPARLRDLSLSESQPLGCSDLRMLRVLVARV